MSRYEISHVSRYYYSKPVQGCVMSLCLKPRDDAAQRLLSFELTTVPPSSMNSEADSFGNTKHVLNINQEHEALEIAALSTVETMAPAPVAGRLGAGAMGGNAFFARLVRVLGLHASERVDRADRRPRRLRGPAGHQGRGRPPGSAHRALGRAPPRPRIRPREHDGSLADRPHPGERPGSVPGLRARHDRHCALLGAHPAATSPVMFRRSPAAWRRHRRLMPGSNACCQA